MTREPARSGTGRGAALGALASIVLLAAAFGLDCASGDEVSSSLFYVVGIGVAAWFVDQRFALLVAGLSAVAWAAAVALVGPVFSKPSVFEWNLGAELVIYLTAAIVLARIRVGVRKERALLEQLHTVTAALEREMHAVGELQREMLPAHVPAIPGYTCVTHYEANSDAGGDYFDFFPLSRGRHAFLVADASGHGPQATVLMAMLRVLLHTSETPLDASGEVLARLDRQIGRTVPPGRFATACHLVLEPATGGIEYSLAGHPPPVLLRAASGEPEELPSAGGPPLGLLSHSRFEAGRGRLEPGDTLVFYTDGVTERMDASGELFGEDRLRDALRGGAALAPADLRARILARLDAHAAGAGLTDDVTLVLLRRECRGDLAISHVLVT